ncbi:Acetyltransferase (GNAT) family protein [Parapedobacter composti]|uniref:Acetyltransferase (GNAT) family protein n=1 Tax=Parapedobacter composti TaxID=623281 RepID=A0A1I1MNG0_9SPHI|nr:GNAT family N-acetyltransferase [Parapedobacter composti]SFC86891.1 Acetyltransferase (GNAT) family protein [Parapedobacter composti]
MENLRIEKLQAKDLTYFKDLIGLFGDVFEMKAFKLPADEYLSRLLANSDFHVFIALQEDAVIGGLTAYTLNQYYSTMPLAYIYDLAVSRQHQRKGLGQALIQTTTTYFRQQGYEEVFVQVDKVDSYAIDFYRQTSPTEEEDVSHFYYTLRKH